MTLCGVFILAVNIKYWFFNTFLCHKVATLLTRLTVFRD